MQINKRRTNLRRQKNHNHFSPCPPQIHRQASRSTLTSSVHLPHLYFVLFLWQNASCPSSVVSCCAGKVAHKQRQTHTHTRSCVTHEVPKRSRCCVPETPFFVFCVFFCRHNVRSVFDCLSLCLAVFFSSHPSQACGMLHRRSALPLAQRGCTRLLHTARVVGSQQWKPLAGPVDEAPRLLRKWTGNAALLSYVERTIVCDHPITSLLLHSSTGASHLPFFPPFFAV